MAYIPIHLGWNTDDGQVQNHRVAAPPVTPSFPPPSGLSDSVLPSTPPPSPSLVDDRRCEFENTSVYYVMFVAVGTYFCPLVILCVVYVRVFGIARRQVARIRKLAVPVSFQSAAAAAPHGRRSFSDRRQSSASSSRQLQPQQQQRKASGGSCDSAARRSCLVVHQHGHHQAAANGLRQAAGTPTTLPAAPTSSSSAVQASETKATVTLGSVVLAFVVCWVPYFVLFAARPFVVTRGGFNVTLELFVLWLGYANSMLNPFLYAFYGSEFRHGFQLVLCRRWWRRGSRGSDSYYNNHHQDVYYL